MEKRKYFKQSCFEAPSKVYGKQYKSCHIHMNRGVIQMAVKLKTRDGKVYTNPRDVFIERNEKTEMFYKLVQAYQPPKPNQQDKTI